MAEIEHANEMHEKIKKQIDETNPTNSPENKNILMQKKIQTKNKSMCAPTTIANVSINGTSEIKIEAISLTTDLLFSQTLFPFTDSLKTLMMMMNRKDEIHI
jgi:hypothetical protein